MIPTFVTFLLKKVVWGEKNYKFDVSGTFIFRIFTENLMK